MTIPKINPEDPMPRYYQVYSSLLERIRTGEFTKGAPLPAERQLAEDYAVSRVTVVKALEELEKEGWIDRQHGRGTFVIQSPEPPQPESVREKPPLIVFVSRDLSHPYLLNILMGIAKTAAQNRYHLQIMNLSYDTMSEAQYIHEAIAYGAEGIVVYPQPGYQNLQIYHELSERGFPIVMVDRYYPQVQTDRVLFDDEAASYQLTELLINKGHQRIAVLPYGEIEATSVRSRLNGYRKALAQHGLEYDEDLIWLDVYAALYLAQEQLEMRTTSQVRLLKRLEAYHPTAIFALNADAARRVTAELLSIKASRAGNATQAKWDNAGMTEVAAISYEQPITYAPYPITIGLQPGELLGVEAAQLLIERMRGNTSEPRTIEIPIQITSANNHIF